MYKEWVPTPQSMSDKDNPYHYAEARNIQKYSSTYNYVYIYNSDTVNKLTQQAQLEHMQRRKDLQEQEKTVHSTG
jgi:hypothetical protein